MTRIRRSAATAACALLLGMSPAGAQTESSPFAGMINTSWGGLKKNLAASAALVSDADYGFKPTPAVRSFGEIVGHLANDHYLICSHAKGEKNPNAADFEKLTNKPALVKALNDSIAYCDGVYATMNDRTGAEVIEMFGGKYTRLRALNINLVHSSEHYGNIVTYLRLRGLVPPSSSPQ